MENQKIVMDEDDIQEQNEELLEQIIELKKELQEFNKREWSLFSVIFDIRRALKVDEKVMLFELADFINFLFEKKKIEVDKDFVNSFLKSSQKTKDVYPKNQIRRLAFLIDL